MSTAVVSLLNCLIYIHKGSVSTTVTENIIGLNLAVVELTTVQVTKLPL
jgi:hypothetical protein